MNKYVWIVVGIIVVLAIIGLSRGSLPQQAGTKSSPTPVGSTKNYGASPSVTPTPAGSMISYADALQRYAGHVIQFDARCQTTPSSLTVKNGTYVMFDNRSGDPRWFALNAVKYSVVGYGFRILPITSTHLPGIVTIDCGSAQNVGQINVNR